MRSRAVMFVLGVACAAAAFATGGGGWVADTWGSYVYKVSPNGSIVRSYGPYVYPYGIGVDEGDNAVLFTVNASEVVKVAFAGGEVWRRTYSSEQISVNAADGGCWVRVYNPRAAARLDRAGNETANVTLANVSWVSSAAGDGSCWVTDGTAGVLLRLSTSGSVLSSFGGFTSPGSCAAHATDNSVSLLEGSNVTRVNTSGSVIFRTPLAGASCLAVNGNDHATWVGAGATLYKLNAAGSVLFSVPVGSSITVVAVNGGDGSSWTALYDLNAVAKYSASGGQLWSLGGFVKVKGLAAEQAPAYPGVAPASMGKIRALFK